MILHYNSRAAKASLLKLHLFSWGLKSEANATLLKKYVTSNFRRRLRFFGIESTLNRALQLAYAEKLIGFDKGKYFLLQKGKDFVKRIDKDDTLFINEKQLLKLIGKTITEKAIDNLVKEWNA